MAQDGYPSDPLTWRSFKKIEERTIRKASFSVFTTPGAAKMYRERYPEAANRISVLENGFDEDSFSSVRLKPGPREPLVPGVLTLLHSGVVYPSERDPRQLFGAIQRLAAAGKVNSRQLRLRFRAAMHENPLRALAREYGIERFIEVLPPIPYGAALEEMLRADALLILQAANCNEQIPAKLYEYLRARRPILGLTDPKGDTAGLLRRAGLDTVAALESVDDIAEMLDSFVLAVTNDRAPLPREDYIASSTRRCRATSFVSLLDQVAV
jgi:glycosyltransferase involved in cell wall biosynthesis